MTILDQLWGPREAALSYTDDENAIWATLQPGLLRGIVGRVLGSFALFGLGSWALARVLSTYAGFTFESPDTVFIAIFAAVFSLIAVTGLRDQAKQQAIRSLRLRRAMDEDIPEPDGSSGDQVRT